MTRFDHYSLIIVSGDAVQATRPGEPNQATLLNPKEWNEKHLIDVCLSTLHSVLLTERLTCFARQGSEDLAPTTSVLTATTLTYAIRAGITAGAGTRLVL